MSRNKVNEQDPQAKRQRLSLSTWRKSGLFIANNLKDSPSEGTKIDDQSEGKKPKTSDPIKKLPSKTKMCKAACDPIRIYAGFSNVGNTCFLNAILHVLRFTPRFLCHLHHLYQVITHFKCKEEKIPATWKLTLELHQVFEAVRKIEIKMSETANEDDQEDDDSSSMDQLHFIPRDLLCSLQYLNPIFKGTLQHDAHELLCWILNTIQEVSLDIWNHLNEEIIAKSKNQKENGSNIRKMLDYQKHCTSKFISDIFTGNMNIETKCAECENVTTIKETFLNVGLSPEQVISEGVEIPTAISKAILKGHYLQGDNKYWCENCHHYNEALRTIRYKKIPPILIIHIERFSNDSNLGTYKISKFIPTPFELECFLDHEDQPCTNQEHRYLLYAVVTHTGFSLCSGHYTAAIRVNRVNLPCSSPKENFENNSNCSKKFCQKFQNQCSCSERQERSSPRTTKKITDYLIRNSSSSSCILCSHTNCCSPYKDKNEIHKLWMEGSHIWINCDDEKCHFLSTEDINAKFSFSANGSTATPYLLFYTRDIASSDQG